MTVTNEVVYLLIEHARIEKKVVPRPYGSGLYHKISLKDANIKKLYWNKDDADKAKLRAEKKGKIVDVLIFKIHGDKKHLNNRITDWKSADKRIEEVANLIEARRMGNLVDRIDWPSADKITDKVLQFSAINLLNDVKFGGTE